MVWGSLEFSMMGFSVIAGIINMVVLIITMLGLCGLKKSNGLVRFGTLKPSEMRRPSA